MNRIFKVTMGLIIMLGLSGCLEITSVIAVSKDGTGTITETMYINRQIMMNIMNQMGGGHGGEMDFDPFESIDDENFDVRADEMGDEVTFVSATRLKKADGSAGIQMVYSFKNIDNLKYKISLENMGPGMGGGPGGGGNQTITFKMEKGDSPRLVINMPKLEKKGKPDAAINRGMHRGGMPDDPQEQAMMKQALQGFRFRSMLKLIDGEIAKSNASFQGIDAKTKQKKFITFLDMDLGKIILDAKQFEKIAEMGSGGGSVLDFVDGLKGAEGLRFEPEEKVEIEIK